MWKYPSEISGKYKPFGFDNYNEDQILAIVKKASYIFNNENLEDVLGNNSKIKKEFNWSPEISLREGIKKTINWYKSLEKAWTNIF